MGQILLNVAAQDDSDFREGAVQTTRQAGHSSRGSERHQCQNQQIFHQALAGFIIVKAIQGAQNQGFHLFGLLLEFFVLFTFPAQPGSAMGTALQPLL
jgi:hypothetical protein